MSKSSLLSIVVWSHTGRAFLKAAVVCIVYVHTRAENLINHTSSLTSLWKLVNMSSEWGAPDCLVSFTASRVHILQPFDWVANPAAPPVEGCDADVPCLCLPLAIWNKVILVAWSSSSEMVHGMQNNWRNWPVSDPQHISLSSMCSTSSPMNHAPSDTSSFANLCSSGLDDKMDSGDISSNSSNGNTA
jgi:hypothetical protein